MHGGAQGSGGPKGARNGNYKHGRYTADTIGNSSVAEGEDSRGKGIDQETASALRVGAPLTRDLEDRSGSTQAAVR